MDKQLYSIFDKVAEIYEPPFVDINDGCAIRRLTDLMKNNPTSTYAQHPDNYTLVCVGTWDDLGGIPLNKVPEKITELMKIITPIDMEK